MEWYYAQDNERRGPISEAELQRLARAGEIQPNTLVWRSGMAEWKAYASTNFSAGPVAPGQIRCTECGGSFPEYEVIKVGNSVVCAGCKPVFLQKVARGDATGSANGIWRWRKQLVVSRNASMLPDRCVKCNEPSESPHLKRKLYWHHPAVYIVVLLNILIYAIVAAAVRKRSEIFVGLCARHQRRRKAFIIAAWGACLLGLGAIGGAIAVDDSTMSPVLGLSAAVLILGGIITGVSGARVVYAAKIDERISKVKGVCGAYLAELPEWTGD